jgi:hypothetical protein
MESNQRKPKLTIINGRQKNIQKKCCGDVIHQQGPQRQHGPKEHQTRNDVNKSRDPMCKDVVMSAVSRDTIEEK